MSKRKTSREGKSQKKNVERMDNGALDWKGKNYILFKLIKTNRSFADESEEAE